MLSKKHKMTKLNYLDKAIETACTTPLQQYQRLSVFIVYKKYKAFPMHPW